METINASHAHTTKPARMTAPHLVLWKEGERTCHEYGNDEAHWGEDNLEEGAKNSGLGERRSLVTPMEPTSPSIVIVEMET